METASTLITVGTFLGKMLDSLPRRLPVTLRLTSGGENPRNG